MIVNRDPLVVRGLSKRYSTGTLANDGIDLDIRAGEVVGLFGPNGAGKTTLVEQIIGLLRPTSGSIMIGSDDLVARPDVARRRCAYLPQGALPLSSLRLQEVVELAGVHRVLPFAHSANLMRAGLTAELVDGTGHSFAILAAWTVISWAVTAWVVGRRA